MNWYKKAAITDYDRGRLENTGQQILETVRLGDYDLTLVHSPISGEGMKQIGLAYRGMSFTDMEQQFGKKEMKGVPNLDLEGMQSKISDWVNEYGILYTGVNNQERLNTYSSILQHLGFNIGREDISGMQFLTITR